MKNFHIKSMLLGIGIGIVLTSIISLIYTAGIENVKMSNQEIIDQAKKLGMVEGSQIINSSTEPSAPQTNTNKDSSSVKINGDSEGTKAVTKADAPTETIKPNTEDKEIKITVSQGEASEAVAEKLLKASLISDKAAFLKELSSLGLTSEINIGEFKIKQGTDTKAIIKIITGKS